jgi:transposase
LGRFRVVDYPVTEERKDPTMRNHGTINVEFQCQVVEELLSGKSRPAQLCRRYNMSSSLLYLWKKQYSRAKLNNEPAEEAALKDRIEKLERLLGHLKLEKEFLKKGCKTVSISVRRTGNHRPVQARHQVCPAGV